MGMTQDRNSIKITDILKQAQDDIDNGRLADAQSRYHLALKWVPSDPQLHLTLGLLYHERGRFAAAIDEIKRAIRLDPTNPNAYRGLGDALDAAGRTESAIAAYESACTLDPKHIQALINLGNAFHKTDQFEKALSSYQKVLQWRPDDPLALNNIGKTFHDMGLLERAVHYYSLALDSHTDYAEAHFNRSVARITMGDYARGWEEYEWRFKRKSAGNVYPYRLSSPRWRGENYQGKRLLVHCEQGFGDVLQFARYLPMVKKRGGILILQAHPPLIPVLKNLDCVDLLVPFDLQTPPDAAHDFHIPLLSLPCIFGTTSTTIPSIIPYLTADPAGSRYWKKQLPASGLKIGMVWSSSPLNEKRNFPIDQYMDRLQLPGLRFYSLQKDMETDQIHALGMEDMGDKLSDFGETAALIQNLDLVISVDTAVAHLVGAMGKPLWVLLPYSSDWRWPPYLPYSPWYPDAKLFRQARMETWDNVTTELVRALRARQLDMPSGNDHVQTTDRPSAAGDQPQHATDIIRPSTQKIKKVLLVSPLYGGSLDVIRYLAAGFQQAGRNTWLLDNSCYYEQFKKINEGAKEDGIKNLKIGKLLAGLDEKLLECAAQYRPDMVLAVAQSPIENHTVQRLKNQGIKCAYWFVEDYRFKAYWSEIAPVYDAFFTIQRDHQLQSKFSEMNYGNWHYLPLACEPNIHKPWIAQGSARRQYDCQLGFMGAPYLNRLKIFDKLTQYDLKIWGEGWNDYELSQALKSCVQKERYRTSPEKSVKIYSSANIVINLHSSPFVEGISAEGGFVNPRTFEVAGCAGFQLTDYRCEIPPLFEPGKEIILFHDLKELYALIDYWLPKDRERAEISRQAQSRAYAHHTYRHRAEEILRIVEKS
jgi:spore maturation protein CgeB/Flp pilus assembly protein TadD